MRRHYFLTALVLWLATVAWAAPTVTPDWTCSFDNPSDFAQFTVIDANGDAFQSSHFKWGTWDYLYSDGSSPYGDDYPDHCVGYTNSEDNDGDDWLITPGLALKAGNTYRLSFKVRAHRASCVERFEVRMGGKATAAAMTTELLAPADYTNTEYKEIELTFTADDDGVEYIGFHALSDTDDMILYLDDIAVKKVADEFKPWSCSFDKQSDFAQFTVIDANGDASPATAFDTWGAWNYLFPGGSSPYGDDYPDHCAGYTSDEDEDADDWLITPAVQLAAGESYVVRFKARAHRPSMPERLEVRYGTAPTAEAMNSTLMAATEIADDSYKDYSFTLKPAAGGNYHVGFHAVSEADNMILYLDDISISKEASALPPSEVTGLAVTPDPFGALTADISFTTPATTTDGSTLADLGGVRIMRGTEQVADITDVKPGKTVMFKDEAAAKAPGMVSYTVLPYNAGGNGTKAEATLWVGIDEPTAPEDVKVSLGDKSVDLKWTASSAVHGGVFMADDVSYTLSMKRETTGEWTNVDVVKGATSASLTSDVNNGAQTRLQMAVTASNSTGQSDRTLGNAVVLGKPYATPFRETFGRKGTNYALWIGEYEGFGCNNGYSGYAPVTTDDASGDGGCADLSTYYEDKVTLLSGKISLDGASAPVMAFSQKTASASGSVVAFVAAPDGSRTVLGTEDLSGNADGGEWAVRKFDLSAFRNCAFVQIGITFDQHEAVYKEQHLLIDNLFVGDLPATDLAVSVAAPKKVRRGHEATVNITVANCGSDASAYTVRLKKDGELLAESKCTEPLAAFGFNTVKVAYTPRWTATDDTETLVAEVEAPGDADNANNVAETDIVVVSPSLPGASSLKAQNVEGSGAVLSWAAPQEVDAVTDGFDDYDPWLIDGVGDWSFIDGDKGETRGLFDYNQVYYDNEKTPFAFIVWNPVNYGGIDATKMYPSVAPFSGDNALASIVSYDVNKDTGEMTPLDADNWLVSPELTGKAQTVSFRVNCMGEDHPEDYEVLWSEGGTEAADFTLVSKATVSAADWRQVNFALPEGAKRFAIRHTTKVVESGSGTGYESYPHLFLVDDVTYAPKGVILRGYMVYRDGTLLGYTPELSFTDTDAPADGTEHTYTVTTVYADGTEAAPVAVSLQIATGINAATEDLSARGTKVYTLDGKLLPSGAKPAKGVYVVNGKKIVVK